ncbi:MAG: hypothetical protein JWR69_1159 [Pedosphaera sp.]|nr:hypothetical protein [Pedosphaera sp.]
MSANAQTLPVPAATASGSAASVPWYCFAVVFGAACIPLGVLWDISWHSTIGRDTFWTPAHMLTYLGGALPGLLCGWIVLKTTFWTAPGDQIPHVRLWGFRGPLGAWVTIWGSFVMIISAPFDNWWHNAYGLDVQILSPPHTVLALGMYGVAVGAALIALSWQNRSPTEQRSTPGRLFLFSCGTLLTMVIIILTEFIYPNHQHSALFYKVTCAVLPLSMIAAVRASNLRWAATVVGGTYALIMLAMIWFLPLFRAQPLLAPIYNPVNHMVPPPFPLLIIVPALGIDLIMRHLGRRPGFWRDTGLACLLGLVFFLLLLAAQWPFSHFLLSPAARNPFFAGDAMWSYADQLGSWRAEFWHVTEDALTLKAAVIAICLASLNSRVALWFGNWLSAVKR